MANKNIEQFITTYGPVAQQVSKEINVDPNILLGQWGLESRWGQTEMAKKHHNLGGIKDFSGKGLEAKDNKTGSVDKYVQFEDPEVFGMYYADQIKRNFPLAVNTGPDVGAFTRGLASGKNGSYFGVPVEEYESSLASAQASLPENRILPFEPTQQGGPKPAGADGDMVTADAPPPPPPSTNVSGASKSERFLGGSIGAGAGLLAAGKQGYNAQKTTNAVKLAGAEEAAREAARRAAAVVPPAPRGGGAPATGGLPTPVGPADAGRMAKGQTGVIPYNTAKALGLTDIEAAQALSNTKQEGGAWDLAEKRREGMRNVQRMGGNNYVENPRFGGIMTQAPSVGRGPRESFVMRPEVPPNPDMPSGQPSQLSALPKAPIVSTVPPPPSGLDQVKNIFTDMMKSSGRALRYVAPPLALYSMGRDVADIESQYDRAPVNRDYTDMGLSLGSALATGASLTPAYPVAAPLAIGLPTFRNIRRNVLAQESDPDLQLRNRMEPTEEEIELANRPYVGYPRQIGQKPFQPRVPPLGTVPPSVIVGN